MLNPNNCESSTSIPYFPTNTINIDPVNITQLELQPTLFLKEKLQEAYRKNDKLPKIVDDEGIPEQKLENTYINLMLIKREEKKETNPEDNQKKQDKKDESRRNDFEDITVEKEDIELEKIFDIKLKNQAEGSNKDSKNKVLIYGRAGVGKTTLCKYITYKWAKGKLWKDKFDYVFHIPLRKLAFKWETIFKNSLEDHALECFIYHCCIFGDVKGVKVKDIVNILKENKILLILDGYDEVEAEHKEANSLTYYILNSLIFSKAENIKIIMTSRPNSVSNQIKQEFNEVENIGLKEENVYKYIANYFPENEEGKKNKKSISEFIRKNNQIREVAQTPINLYLLCLVWNKENNLQKQTDITLTNLYERIMNWLMKKYLCKFKGYEASRLGDNEVEEKCADEYEQLEKIAYTGMVSHQIIIGQNLLEQIELRKSDVLEDLKTIGILHVVGEGFKLVDKNHEFIHLTFQEYMTARYVAKMLAGQDKEEVREAVRFIEKIKYERFYERMIIFLSGVVNKQRGQAQKYFWHILLNGENDLTLRRQALLLFKCLNEAEEGHIRSIPKYSRIGKLLGEYVKKEIDNANDNLFEELCACKNSIRFLLEKQYLTLEIPNATKENIKKLARLARISDQAKNIISNKWCLLLEKEIISWNYFNFDFLMRSAIIRGINHKIALRNAILIINSSNNINSIIRAVRLIGEISKYKPKLINEEIVNILVKLIEDRNIKWPIDEGCLNILPIKIHKKITKYPLHLLYRLSIQGDNNEDEEVEEKQVVNIKREEIREAQNMMNDDNNLGARYHPIYALNEIADVSPELITVELLGKLFLVLKDEDPYVRSVAIYSIGKMIRRKTEFLTKDNIAKLHESLYDKEESVVKSVKKTLIRISEQLNSNLVASNLFEILSSNKDNRIYQKTLEILGKLKIEDKQLVLQIIQYALKHALHSECFKRMGAVKFLGKLGEVVGTTQIEVVVYALTTRFNDINDEIRQAALEALGKLNLGLIKSQTIISVLALELADQLRDKNHKVRGLAAFVLGKLKEVHPVIKQLIGSTLIKLLSKEKDHIVQTCVAFALYEMKIEGALENILKVFSKGYSTGRKDKIILLSLFQSNVKLLLKDFNVKVSDYENRFFDKISLKKEEIKKGILTEPLITIMKDIITLFLEDKLDNYNIIVEIAKMSPELINEIVVKKILEIKDKNIRDDFIEFWKYNSNKKISIKENNTNDKQVLEEALLLFTKNTNNEDSYNIRKALKNFTFEHQIKAILNNKYYFIFNSEIFSEFISQFKHQDKSITLKLNKLLVYEKGKNIALFNEDDNWRKYQVARKIFNAFYEYNLSNNMPTIFFELACNYRRSFDIKGVELIADIISTNEYLEESSRSLIDSQYKLSALNWTISIVRKDKTVSKNEKHVFMILEGKSIFYTSILHRFELIQQGGKGTIGEIVINSQMHISNEMLDKCSQEILGNARYLEGFKFEKNKHYYAKTCAIDFEKVDALCEEIYQEQPNPPSYNLRGNKAATNSSIGGFLSFLGFKDSAELIEGNGHNCFTWAREKLEKYLDKEEFGKLSLTTWQDFIASDPTKVLGKEH